MAFEVLELSIDVCKQLRPVLQQIQEHDTRLARQLRDAASSCPLNIAEGNRRRGRDPAVLYPDDPELARRP